MNKGMKRVLLGSTAIVGLSLLLPAPVNAAEPVSLSLTGRVNVEFQSVSQDDEADFGSRGYNLQTDDAGFDLKAEGTSDNGLVYGAKIEIDSDASGGAVGIDELMLYFSGGWGRLEMGSEDGADQVMAHGGFSVLSGDGGHDGGYKDAFDVNAVTADIDVDNTGDANKITYYTPRVGGIQLGISYTPDSDSNFATSLDTANAASGFENFIGVGVNFVSSFDDVGIRLAGIVANGDSQTIGTNDIDGYSIGGQVDFGDISVASSYGDNGDSAEAGTIESKKWFDLGIRYTMGDYTYSIGYLNAGSDTGVVGEDDDSLKVYSIGAGYALAPGLALRAEVLHASVDQEGNGDGVDNEGTVFTVGTTLSF